MKPKTIAFTIYSLSSGGAERVVTTLANAFCPSYNVVIITLADCVSFYHLDSRITLVGCNLAEGSENIPRRLLSYFRTLKTLRRHLDTHKVDILISFTTTVNVFSILAARQANIKCIISERNNPYLRIPNLLWKTLRDWLYKKADALVVQTNASVAFFGRLMPSNKIVIVPNPLSRLLIDKRILPRAKKETNTILSVGRLDQNKAQDLLIKAFANINKDDWNIQLLGDGNQLENYKTLAKKLGVTDKVEFLGMRKNVWDFYNSGDIFVFTSRSEGFPNALTEALYFGMPCISTNCPNGPSELIIDGENGFLIEVDDQENLEKKLSLLINDVNLRNQFSKKAIKSSMAFETEPVRAKWENLIEHVFAKNS